MHIKIALLTATIVSTMELSGMNEDNPIKEQYSHLAQQYYPVQKEKFNSVNNAFEYMKQVAKKKENNHLNEIIKTIPAHDNNLTTAFQLILYGIKPGLWRNPLNTICVSIPLMDLQAEAFLIDVVNKCKREGLLKDSEKTNA